MKDELKNLEEYGAGTEYGALEEKEIMNVLKGMVKALPQAERILLVPPDITRRYSYAGPATAYFYHELSRRARVEIMPALGTHRAMTREEQILLFGPDIPEEAYLYHDWRQDTVKIGTVPAEFISRVSAGRWTKAMEAETDRRLMDGTYDLVISVGQVVPHEVIGMANYTKNILVGLGGRGMINDSHLMGAVCGMERIIGNIDSPVRAVFDYAQEHFLKNVPLVYVLTVTGQEKEKTAVYGIFAGTSRHVFEEAGKLAMRRNIIYVPKPMKKVVAYLEPGEFTTAWVGNKSIYRTRMMIEDGGELLVIAPGLRGFGENEEVDGLLRKYGYRGTEYTMDLVRKGVFERTGMAPAHMIHSSSEGRFSITYAVDPENISPEEMRQVGYEYMDVREAMARYPMDRLKEGFQVTEDGEEIYVVKNPALGLWKVGP